MGIANSIENINPKLNAIMKTNEKLMKTNELTKECVTQAANALKIMKNKVDTLEAQVKNGNKIETDEAMIRRVLAAVTNKQTAPTKTAEEIRIEQLTKLLEKFKKEKNQRRRQRRR